jgi:methionyl-tRNA formyltransferase
MINNNKNSQNNNKYHKNKKNNNNETFIFKQNSANEDENIQNYNIAVVISYGYLIPNKIISKLQYGGVNVHPSELPFYRGAAPLYQQLLFNDPTSAVSVIRLHPEVFDSG